MSAEETMKLRERIFAGAMALLVMGAAAPQGASAASVHAQFASAVSRVLYGIRGSQQALADMSNSEFSSFVACAQNVMSDAPTARKQYVLAARNASEQRRRFDEVALDNRATLKQRITRECYR